jgi:hypothetical protein
MTIVGKPSGLALHVLVQESLFATVAFPPEHPGPPAHAAGMLRLQMQARITVRVNTRRIPFSFLEQNFVSPNAGLRRRRFFSAIAPFHPPVRIRRLLWRDHVKVCHYTNVQVLARVRRPPDVITGMASSLFRMPAAAALAQFSQDVL